jgi:hypothetical protein
MDKQNRKAVKVTAAVVGAMSFVYGIVPMGGADNECGTTLFPGRNASRGSCEDMSLVPPGLLWVLIVAGIGGFIYLQTLDSQATDEDT